MNSKKQTKLVAVLNLTPDSFSDGGRFEKEDLLEVAGQMLLDGADILEIGGESTAPGSVDVTVEEEHRRVIPALQRLRAAFPAATISVDTWKSEVAKAALEAGANWINDVTAGRGDERIFEVVAKTNAPFVLMYSKEASPRTTRLEIDYDDVVETIKTFLRGRMVVAREHGISEIIVDTGMGAFVSGNPDYSFEILDRMEEFYDLGVPIMVGASRKGFLGEDRLGGTLVVTDYLRGRVDYLRVHDVLENTTVTG